VLSAATEELLLDVPSIAGFEFSTFEMGKKERLLEQFPAAAGWIDRLMAE
jgi:predicted cupin superfamily sugar epimerase